MTCSPMRFVFGAGVGAGAGVFVGVDPIYLPSLIMSSSVTERASIGNPWIWQIDRKRGVNFDLPLATTSGRGTADRAVSNFLLIRSILRSKSSGRSLYCPFSL